MRCVDCMFKCTTCGRELSRWGEFITYLLSHFISALIVGTVAYFTLKGVGYTYTFWTVIGLAFLFNQVVEAVQKRDCK
jgi:hypothetical protein